jgi:Na+/H+-translocating membrane pyrophosphatase
MLITDLIDLQTYQEKPDYARCVSIVASASLREMIKPGALAVISPIVIGNGGLRCCQDVPELMLMTRVSLVLVFPVYNVRI